MSLSSSSSSDGHGGDDNGHQSLPLYDESRRVILKNASVWKWTSSPSSGKCTGEIMSDRQDVEVVDGRIQSIAPSNAVSVNHEDTRIESSGTIIDCKGQLLIPGLIDSHIHVEMLGESQYYVNLDNCYSMSDLELSVTAAADKDPSLPFIVGYNWDQSKLGSMPSRQQLDLLPIDKPIFLWRACWHIGVANTRALQLANILSAEDIQVSDAPNSIDPAGILREREVEPLVAALATYKTTEQALRFLKEGLQLCLRAGLTCVQSNDENRLQAYLQMDATHALPIRVSLTAGQKEVHQLVTQWPLTPVHMMTDDRGLRTLSVDRVKLYTDGSLGAETAALLTNAPALQLDLQEWKFHKGILIHSLEELQTMIEDSTRAGYRVEVHAIGDAAAAQFLHALSNAQTQLHREGLLIDRPVLTHCQVLHPLLIEKMKEYHVIANVQPSFVPTDMRWLSQRLTPFQTDHSYCWKTLLYSDVHVAGGSDAPIESPNPFLGMYDAIFRSNQHRQEEGHEVFRPSECLTFAEALWIYTVEGAYAMHCEDVLGSIEIGCIADLVLIDPQCVTDPERLYSLTPQLVVVGGKVQFVDESSSIDIIASPLTVTKSLPHSEGQRSPTYVQHIAEDAPFIPGRGGQFPLKKSRKTCQIIGVCPCKLNGTFCF